MTRLRGLLWLTAGLVIAMVAGLVGYNSLSRAVAAPAPQQAAAVPMEKVVVAAHSMESHRLLTAEDVLLKELPSAAVPQNALRSVDDVVGQLVTAELYEGEVLVATRLVKPNIYTPGSDIAASIAEDQVLLALPARDFMSQLDLLKPGDHVDVLFSLKFPEERNPTLKSDEADKEQPATFHTLQNVTIAALSGGSAVTDAANPTTVPAGVLLALTPQDAMTLKFAVDAGGTLDFVLRAPGVDRTFQTDPVDVDYLIQRYNIPIGPGE